MEFRSEYAKIPLEKEVVQIISVPCMKEIRNGNFTDYVTHFDARKRTGELIRCTATHERARVARDLNVGADVVVSLSVKIIPMENSLEYDYSGFFICVDPSTRKLCIWD